MASEQPLVSAPILTFDENDDIRMTTRDSLSDRSIFIHRFCHTLLSYVGSIALVILYLIFGGWMFSRIESGYEDEQQKQIQIHHSQSIDDIRTIVDQEFNWKLNRSFELHYALWRGMLSRMDSPRQTYWYVHVSPERFDRLIDQVLARLYNEQEKFFDKQDTRTDWISTQKWSYSSAMLFAATLITTVGYGNITPKSVLGKIITCLYAMFGIPIMIIYLTHTGNSLAFLFINYYSLLHRKICSCSRLQSNDKKLSRVPILATMTVLILYLLAGALLFSHWEGWSYIDGAYFSFITFTTIGLGDLVPGKGTLTENKNGKTILCAIYLLFGLILTAMCFKLIQEDFFAIKERVIDRLALTRTKKKNTALLFRFPRVTQ